MNPAGRLALAAVLCSLANAGGVRSGQWQPQTLHDFECYVQSAEARMDSRQPFLLADANPALNAQVVHGKIQTIAPNGANPHKITGGQLYDWVGTVFIPGATLERLIRMLQDYDHRARYFPDVIAASKLLCRRGENQFRFTMRLKEPAVIDTEDEVVWEQVDPHRWRCRSYSTNVQEVGKDHGYLRQLYSYWRVAEVEKGVYVEGQTITVSDAFGSLTRAIGSMMGINPEKSLKRSLESMRDSVLKPGAEFPAPASGLPECGEPFRPGNCASKPAQ